MENNNSTKIDLYLDGKLTTQEQSAFENEMNQDAALKKEVRLHELERRAVRELLKNNFREKIKKSTASSSASWEALTGKKTETTGAPKVIKMSPYKRILSIAASVLILVMGTTWWSNTQFSNDSLLAEGYYQAASAGNKSGEGTISPIFQGGLNAYFIEKDYIQAIQQFEAIPSMDDNYTAAQYYLGHSYLQEKQFPQSIAAFEKVLQTPAIPAFINTEEVVWNQLMSYLGKGDTGSDFQQKLTGLINTGKPPFQKKAQALQQQLTSFWRKLVF